MARARRAGALVAVMIGVWTPGALGSGLHADALHTHQVLAAPSGIQTSAPVTTARAVARGPRTVAVVMFNFASLPASPWTADEVRAAIFTGPASLNAFEREQSFGALALTGKARPDGDVFGWYTIPQGTTTCDPDAWMAGATAAASAAGVDLTGYQHRIFVFPQVAACPWAGTADMPGTDSFINGTLAVRVLAHELGHNLGAEHASALTCVDAAGAAVSFSTSCAQSDYGDPFDVMGIGERHYSAFRKAEAGFLPASATLTAVQTGTYTIASSSVLPGSVATVRIRRGATPEYWYADLRSPTGVFENVPADDPAVTGVAVRLAGDYRTAARTRLIDGSPATPTFADAPLRAGQTFTDPTTGVAIAVRAVALGAATVRVTIPGTVALNPDVVVTPAPVVDAASQDAAVDARVVATASLRRVSAMRGVLRIVVPVSDGPHRCVARVAAGASINCRIVGARATVVRSVALPRRTLPVQLRLDGDVVLSVRLRVPRAGQLTRLTTSLLV